MRDKIPRMIEVIRPGKPLTLSGVSAALRRTRVQVKGRALSSDEVRVKDGLRLTSPARSLVDFAANAPVTQLKFAFLEACRLRYFQRPDVDYCFHRIAGRRGAMKLRPLLGAWVPELNRIRSVLEGMFLLEWVKTGLEMPKVNVKVHGYEVDFFWRKYGVVLELDGDAFHSDPMAKKRDAAKTRALEERGLLVIRVSYREMRDHPEQVIRRVAAVLAAR